METITLKISCPDRPGLIATITQFIFQNKGNIVNLDQHTDTGQEKFFMRVEWEKKNFEIEQRKLFFEFEKFLKSKKIEAQWKIFFSSIKPRMAIFVSRQDHCLWDILLRHKANELFCDIPLVISNHKDLKEKVENFGIRFEYIPLNKKNKYRQEEKELRLLEENKIDFVVLARYMQILSATFIENFPNKIINIHHSFLPAFKGSNPYRQAHQRGVKIIGATAHFASETLDQGPIIAQDVAPVSYKDDVQSLTIKGRDIERLVLAKALKLFIQNRIFVLENRTIVL